MAMTVPKRTIEREEEVGGTLRGLLSAALLSLPAWLVVLIAVREWIA